MAVTAGAAGAVGAGIYLAANTFIPEYEAYQMQNEKSALAEQMEDQLPGTPEFMLRSIGATVLIVGGGATLIDVSKKK